MKFAELKYFMDKWHHGPAGKRCKAEEYIPFQADYDFGLDTGVVTALLYLEIIRMQKEIDALKARRGI